MGTCQSKTNDWESVRRNRNRANLKSSRLVKKLSENKELRDTVAAIFAKFDKDGDGFLDKKEIKQLVKHSLAKKRERRESNFEEQGALHLSQTLGKTEEGKISPEELFKFYLK